MTVLHHIHRWVLAQPLMLWVILALALGLRLFQLTEVGLWTDEAFSVNVARLPFVEMCRRIAWDGVHPPFFYFLLHPWILIFGDSEAAVRSLSAVYGMLTVLVIYMVTTRFYSRRVGLVAAFLVATSSFYLFYSQEARMYIFMAPPALVSFYALYRLVYDRRLIVYAAYFVSTVVFLYTHIFGVFYVVAQNIYYLGLMVLGRDNRPKLSHWIALQSATILAFVPWLPFVVDKAQRQNARGTFWLEAPDLNAIILLFGSFAGSWLGLVAFTGVLSAAAFFGIRRAWSGKRHVITADQFRKEGLLVLWIFVPIVVTALYSILVDPILYPRYVLPSALPIYILVAFTLVHWTRHSTRNTAIVGVLLASLTGYQVYSYYSDDIRANHYRLRHDWRTATAYLVENSDKDTIIVCPGTCSPLDYYLRHINIPKAKVAVLRAGARAPMLERRTSKLGKDLEGFKTVWLVTTSGRDPDELARKILEDRFQLQSTAEFDDLINMDRYGSAQ